MNATILFRLAIFVFLLAFIDWYAFQAIKTAFRGNVARWMYWIFSGLVYAGIIYLFFAFNRSEGPSLRFQYIMALVILSLVPKLVIILILFFEDIVRFLLGIFTKVSGNSEGNFLPDRRKFVSQIGLGLAAIPFLGILHGVWRGRYNYRVTKNTVFFKDLPDDFDGFKITQISDIHSGSFDNKSKIEYGIDLINKQQSDVIFFTGDLVNNRADEMKPWVESFAKLDAPLGKFSILGNHDYGDYVDWNSAQAKRENMERLFEIHKELGFQLLKNENVKIRKGNSEVDLIGVENWGAGGFAKHGDLEKAAQNLDEKSFKILLSHDPSHFDAVVKNFQKFIHLTLSGHTHGMQFGIEIPGWIKWSPVKYRYPKWAGLYEDLGRKLYVNRGFGFLAFPGRVGIWPEITVLELRKG